MPFFLFVLRFFTTLWLLLIPIGFWAGTRGGERWLARFWRGFTWAFGAWVLSASAFIILYLLKEESSILISETANYGVFLGLGLLLGSVWAAGVWRRIRQQQRLKNADAALAWLQALSAQNFEALVGRYFKSQGHIVRRVGQSGDHGVDLAVYTPDQGKWIVQCKRYRQRAVGESTVRDLYGAMMHEHADRGFIFTTSTFSVHAHNWAEDKEIVLVNGEELVSRLHRQRVRFNSTLNLRAGS